jgi:hypothetical protein
LMRFGRMAWECNLLAFMDGSGESMRVLAMAFEIFMSKSYLPTR